MKPLLAALALCAGVGADAATLALRILETTDVHMQLLPWDYYQDKPTDEYGYARAATLIRAARAEAPNTLYFDNGDLLQGSPLGDQVARVDPLQPRALHPAYRVLSEMGVDAANIGNHEFNYGLPFLQRAIAAAPFPVLNANVYLVGPQAAAPPSPGGSESTGRAGSTPVSPQAAAPPSPEGSESTGRAGSTPVSPQAAAPPSPEGSESTGRAGSTLPEGERHAFTPYVILERSFKDSTGAARTLKVGVIGFVPPQILQWDRQNLLGRVVVRDIVETARRYVPEIRSRGADIVVAIPHSGFERGETVGFAENVVARLAEVPGIDAILFGHSHGEFPGRFFAGHPKVDLARGTINGVPATMPGRWGDHIGVIDLVLDDAGGAWKVASSQAALRPVWDRMAKKPLAEPDARVAALVSAEHQATRKTLRAEVARSSAPIESYFAQVADDASVQIVAQAQAAQVRRLAGGTPYEGLPLLSAAAPFKTGGRMGWSYYTDIPAGPLSLRNVADLYVYPNTVKAVLLTGDQVREWLEFSAGQFNRIDPAGPPEQELLNPGFVSYNFDSIEGVGYAIDVTQPARYERGGKLVAPAAHRIVDLRWNGKPIDESARFLVATNNYRASGGGAFPNLDGRTIVIDGADETREALAQHLKTLQRFDPGADGNWRVLPVPGVRLRFTSGSGGIAHLARHAGIALVQDNGDGSALYELRP